MGLVRGARPWGLPGPRLLKFSPQTLTQGTLVPRSLGSPPRHRLDFLQAQGPLSCLHVGWSLRPRTRSWGDFLTRAATVSCSETPCGRPTPRPVPGGSWGQLSLPQRVSSREGPVSMADGDHERPRLWAGPLPTSVLKTRRLGVKWDRGPQKGFWRHIWLRETCIFSWACGQGSRERETHLGRSVLGSQGSHPASFCSGPAVSASAADPSRSERGTLTWRSWPARFPWTSWRASWHSGVAVSPQTSPWSFVRRWPRGSECWGGGVGSEGRLRAPESLVPFVNRVWAPKGTWKAVLTCLSPSGRP